MKLKRSLVTVLSGAIIAMGGLVVLPSVASAQGAAVLWVAPHPANGSGTSCAHNGYSTIQSAINAAASGATIHVCAGTYAEQLTIQKSVLINASTTPVTVKLPAVPANATTTCDTTGNPDTPDQDGIVICGAVTVQLAGITVDAAWPANTCNDNEYGVLVAGTATLRFTNSKLTAAGDFPSGCQGGVGIQVGMAWTTPVEVGHATISGSSVSGYQKNGITVDGLHSSATITNTTVTGGGFHTPNAQNGIQVSNGATASITHATVTDNECGTTLNQTCGSEGYQGGGVLFYASAHGSSLTNSVIDNNDYGVYFYGDPAIANSSVLINGDHFTNENYASALLDQGSTTFSHNVITTASSYKPSQCNGVAALGGSSFTTHYTSVCGYHQHNATFANNVSTIGVLMYQYNGQSYGAKAIGSGDTIDNQYDGVFVSSDDNRSDHKGMINISSAFSGSGNVNTLVNTAPTTLFSASV